MAKIYKVWIEIEEYDTEIESGKTVDAPFPSTGDFETYEMAVEFAQKMHDSFEQ